MCSSFQVNISNTWTLPQEGFSVFYRFFRDKISWFEADAVCQFHHANLVTGKRLRVRTLKADWYVADGWMMMSSVKILVGGRANLRSRQILYVLPCLLTVSAIRKWGFLTPSCWRLHAYASDALNRCIWFWANMCLQFQLKAYVWLTAVVMLLLCASSFKLTIKRILHFKLQIAWNPVCLGTMKWGKPINVALNSMHKCIISSCVIWKKKSINNSSQSASSNF